MTTPASRTAAVLMRLPQVVIIAVLVGYRRIVSPLYGRVCRFFPSCSAYALEAVTVHGAVKGTLFAVRRLAHCHPWNDGGVDHVPAGGKKFTDGRIPEIVLLNHPVIPADEDSGPAALRS